MDIKFTIRVLGALGKGLIFFAGIAVCTFLMLWIGWNFFCRNSAISKIEYGQVEINLQNP